MLNNTIFNKVSVGTLFLISRNVIPTFSNLKTEIRDLSRLSESAMQ